MAYMRMYRPVGLPELGHEPAVRSNLDERQLLAENHDDVND